jgi:hypothetical protein
MFKMMLLQLQSKYKQTNFKYNTCADEAVLMVRLKFTAKNPSEVGSTKDHQLSEPSRPTTNN